MPLTSEFPTTVGQVLLKGLLLVRTNSVHKRHFKFSLLYDVRFYIFDICIYIKYIYQVEWNSCWRFGALTLFSIVEANVNLFFLCVFLELLIHYLN